MILPFFPEIGISRVLHVLEVEFEKKSRLWLWLSLCIHVLEFYNFDICLYKSELSTLEP